MKYLVGLTVLIAVIASCGRANSDSTHAEVIPVSQVGYTCFVIKDSDGKAVGGNCLKN